MSPWVIALLSTTAIDSIMCGTVLLSNNVLNRKSGVPKLRPAQPVVEHFYRGSCLGCLNGSYATVMVIKFWNNLYQMYNHPKLDGYSHPILE